MLHKDHRQNGILIQPENNTESACPTAVLRSPGTHFLFALFFDTVSALVAAVIHMIVHGIYRAERTE